MIDFSSKPDAVFEHWRKAALRHESGRVFISFGVFANLDEKHRCSMIGTLVEWALGSDSSAVAQYEASEDVATGALPWHEALSFADLAANALFGLVTRYEESQSLLRTHLVALKQAKASVSLSRVLATLGEGTHRPLLTTLFEDTSATSRVLTAAAIAWERSNRDIAVRLIDLLAVPTNTRVPAMMEICQILGADDCWQPLYGPLRTWCAEVYLLLPSIQRPAASEFAMAVVSILAQEVTNHDAFTIEPSANDSEVVALGEALDARSRQDSSQQRIDINRWSTFGPFEKRWVTARLYRRLVHFKPDPQALDALLTIRPPGYQQSLKELLAHFEWIDQYSEPSALRRRLRDLVADFDPTCEVNGEQ